jgi:hypothetical protein
MSSLDYDKNRYVRRVFGCLVAFDGVAPLVIGSRYTSGP